MKIYTALILTMWINTSFVAQVLTDDKLYELGYNELQSRNWTAASNYLYAYIQRNPVAFEKDKGYQSNVVKAYSTSYQYIIDEKTDLENQIANKNNLIDDLYRELGRQPSLSIGVIIPPEIPSLKEPVKKPVKLKNPKFLQQGMSLTGQWKATLTSSGGGVFTGTLIVVTNEDVVTGTFAISDLSDDKVTGMYDDANLVLMRNTGVATIQTYILKRINENHFSGTYRNEGNVPDEGRIELVR